MSQIIKVEFSSSQTNAGKVILKECIGSDAEESADLFLHELLFNVKQQPNREVSMIVTLENDISWETGFDLEYTYLTDTVRGLIIRSVQEETCYGDEPAEARRFLDAINKPERKTKYGDKETRIGPMFFDTAKLDPKEAAAAMMAEMQRKNEFFLSQHRVDLYKKKLKRVEIFIEAYIDLENGNLVIHGHDLGPKVEECFGKSEYEYWRTVPCQAKEKMLTILKAMTPSDRLHRLTIMYKHPDIILVRLVKEHFSKDTAAGDFEQWCAEQGIECESFSC